MTLEEKFVDACKAGRLEEVKQLLQEPRLDPNMLSCDPEDPDFTAPPIVMAYVSNQVDIVRLLLADPRVDPARSASTGLTVFEGFCYSGNEEMVKLLLADPRVSPDPAGCSFSPLHAASSEGHAEVVKLLLQDARVDPARQDSDGETALHHAAWGAPAEGLRLLLADGRVNPSIQSLNGKTALHWACWGGSLEGVRLLLEDPRTDPALQDERGRTPFYRACETPDIEILRLLLADPRIDPCVANKDGWTGFLESCSYFENSWTGFLEGCSYFENGLEVVELLLADERIVSALTAEKEKSALDWVYEWMVAAEIPEVWDHYSQVWDMLLERGVAFLKHKPLHLASPQKSPRPEAGRQDTVGKQHEAGGSGLPKAAERS